MTKIDPWQNALKQLADAAKIMKLDAGIHEMLANPKKILTVSLPVKMDDVESRFSQVIDHNIMTLEVHTREE